jgi:hypothetical protein
MRNGWHRCHTLRTVLCRCCDEVVQLVASFGILAGVAMKH